MSSVFRLFALALLGFGLVVGSAYADNAPAPAGKQGQWCAENPEKCEQMKKRMEEHCAKDPKRCEEIRARMEKRWAWCEANPEECKKQREEFEKRRAEWRAKCEANPEECKKKREEYRKHRGMPEKEGT